MREEASTGWSVGPSSASAGEAGATGPTDAVGPGTVAELLPQVQRFRALLLDRDRRIRELEELLAAEVHLWTAKRDAERERTQRARLDRDEALAALAATQDLLSREQARVNAVTIEKERLREELLALKMGDLPDPKSPTARIAEQLRAAVSAQQNAALERELAALREELESARARVRFLEIRTRRTDTHLALLSDELNERHIDEPPLEPPCEGTWEELDFDLMATTPPKPTRRRTYDEWEDLPRDVAFPDDPSD